MVGGSVGRLLPRHPAVQVLAAVVRSLENGESQSNSGVEQAVGNKGLGNQIRADRVNESKVSQNRVAVRAVSQGQAGSDQSLTGKHNRNQSVS